MKSKIFGLLPLVLIVLGFSIMTILYLAKMDLLGALIIMAFGLCTAIASPIFYLKNNFVSIFFLNPFRKKKIINLKETNKIIFDIGLSYHKVIFSGNEFNIAVNTLMPPFTVIPIWEIKRLYKYLVSVGVNVESIGAGAMDWNP